jgi:hypothetical protein
MTRLIVSTVRRVKKRTGAVNPLGTVVQQLHHLVFCIEKNICERLWQRFMYTDVSECSNCHVRGVFCDLVYIFLEYTLFILEGTFPGATYRLTRGLCYFVVLDETSKSLKGFLPVCGSTRVIRVLLDFRPTTGYCKIIGPPHTYNL